MCKACFLLSLILVHLFFTPHVFVSLSMLAMSGIKNVEVQYSPQGNWHWTSKQGEGESSGHIGIGLNKCLLKVLFVRSTIWINSCLNFCSILVGYFIGSYKTAHSVFILIEKLKMSKCMILLNKSIFILYMFITWL